MTGGLDLALVRDGVLSAIACRPSREGMHMQIGELHSGQYPSQGGYFDIETKDSLVRVTLWVGVVEVHDQPRSGGAPTVKTLKGPTLELVLLTIAGCLE